MAKDTQDPSTSEAVSLADLPTSWMLLATVGTAGAVVVVKEFS